MECMRTLTIAGESLTTMDDAFSALFAAWKAPSWHGRNFNALRDSLITGDINGIEPPFRIVVSGSSAMGPGARALFNDFADLLREIRGELDATGRSIEFEMS